MTGALFNPISFVWFPYHFDSCLNYVCVHFRRAGAADRRSPCGCQGRMAELGLLGEGGLSLVAAGAPPRGSRELLSRRCQRRSRCGFARNFSLFPPWPRLSLGWFNSGSGFTPRKRGSLPLPSGRIANDSLKGTFFKKKTKQKNG